MVVDTWDRTFSGNLTGNLALTKKGWNALELKGTGNTYTGLTDVQVGTLIPATATALGDIGTGTTVHSGATLYLQDGRTYYEPLTLAGKLWNYWSTNYWSGPITLDGTNSSVVASYGPLVVDGKISGSGDLSYGGHGTLYLKNTGNDYTGATRIYGPNFVVDVSEVIPDGSDVILDGTTALGGTAYLNLRGHSETIKSLRSTGTGGTGVTSDLGSTAVTLTIADGNNAVFGGVIQNGYDTVSVVKTGGGTQTLSGNNTYSGSTTIEAGTLKLGHLNALGATTNGTTIQSGATLDLNGVYASASSNEAISVSGTGVGGNGAIISSSAGIVNEGFGNLTLDGDTTIGGDHRWAIRGGTTFTGNNHTLTKTGGFQLVVTSPLNGADIVLNAGRLTIQTSNALGTGGPTNTTTVNTGAVLAYYGGYTVPEKIIFSGGSLESEFADTTFTGPITFNATTTINTTATARNMTSRSPGPSTATGGLNKFGSSTLTLSGTGNSYSGGTTVSEGNCGWPPAESSPTAWQRQRHRNGTLGPGRLQRDHQRPVRRRSHRQFRSGGPYVLTVGNNNQDQYVRRPAQKHHRHVGLTKTGSGTLTLPQQHVHGDNECQCRDAGLWRLARQ